MLLLKKKKKKTIFIFTNIRRYYIIKLRQDSIKSKRNRRMTTEERVSKLEEVIPEIKTGIAEIKIILRERQTQENLVNDNIKKDIAEINQKLDGVLKETPKIAEHEKRINNIEDGQKWLWRTAGAVIIATVIELIFMGVQHLH